MVATEDFAREQRGVAVAMGAAVATLVVVLAIVVMANRTAAAMPFAERIQFTIGADMFVVVWLAAAIANTARLRFFSPQDIGGSIAGTESEAVRVARAILQNTLEQVVLAMAAHLAVAAVFARPVAPVMALVALFAIGRLLFWAGYRQGAKRRAFGFALGFYPGVVALLASCATVLLGWAA